MGQGIDLLGAMTRIRPERPPAPVDAARLRSLVLIKLSSIGDVVQALPVASALRRAHPALRITWVAEEWTAPLVCDHPAVDRVIVFPTLVRWPSHMGEWRRHLAAAVRELRRERYDVAVDLQGLARSAAISALSRAPVRVARAGQREGAHLVSRGVPMPSTPVHAVDEYLQVAAFLGAPLAPPAFELRPRRDAVEAIAGRLADRGVGAGQPLIVLNASATQRWKEWEPSRWVVVVDALSDAAPVVLVGSAAHRTRHAAIAREARCTPLDWTGRTTLPELVALLDRASLHLAPDTGTVHIAAALGTPVVAVYGPTRPARIGPHGQPESTVDHGDLCGAECPAYCLRGRRCLAAATPDEVIARARARLASSCGSIAAVSR